MAKSSWRSSSQATPSMMGDRPPHWDVWMNQDRQQLNPLFVPFAQPSVRQQMKRGERA